MGTFPFPLNSYAGFEALFKASDSSSPAALPVSSPTKPFWSHPGLSKDWPTNKDDPEGYKTTNPYAREGSEGALTEQADVVIIGSGITGISVALELARIVRSGERRNMRKIVILEARDFCSGATARNGGHLTAVISHNYSGLAKLYDPEEVKRCFALERHTVSSLLNLIEAQSWAQYVDLVDGGHNVLLFSEQERQQAVEDYENALNAGIITGDQIKWLRAEDTQKEYGASYPMYRTAGHNLWPLKLVTKMFELARGGKSSIFTKDTTMKAQEPVQTDQNQTPGWVAGPYDLLNKIFPFSTEAEECAESESASALPLVPPKSQAFELILHTHTPAHEVLPNRSNTTSKWSVQTSRGPILTDRVIYATNAYTSHLLPHLSGPQGIVPVRGQVVAIRADVGYEDEGWEGTGQRQGLSRSGWSGNEGFEYWFPRPHPKAVNPLSPGEQKKPLVILGGARETLRNGGYGMYETDDSVLDPEASAGLRAFLGNVFPGKFPPSQKMSVMTNNDGQGGVEVEWSGIMGFTRSGDPFVGRVKDAEGVVIEGQYIVAGFTGHGMPRAYGCAEVLASLIWSDIEGSRWTPPEWFPRHYLTETF